MQFFSPSRPWLRTAAIGAVVVALGVGTLLTAWQVALARVPKHRATLERLVRAHTGLDVRFNELGLRWGWYGPEAVFRNVELGEPGEAASLLRAPELTVGFDAWRTMQTGQLRAGRVTLVAPEIDFVRPARPSARRGRPSGNEFVRALRGWQGGRIDVESAAVRMPFGEGALTLRIPRGTLRRSEDVWSASMQMMLPDRLGRTARLALQLEGDPGSVDSLSGRVRFEGERLAFAGWRDLLSPRMPLARHVPARGSGNVTMRVTLSGGAIEQLTGEVRADDVRLASLAAPVDVGYLNGNWKAVRQGQRWRLDVRDLRAGPEGRDAAPATIVLDVDTAQRTAHARIDLAPVATLLRAVEAGVRDVSLAGVTARGVAQDVDVRWDGLAAPGARLRASGTAPQVSLAVPSRGFAIADTRVRFSATDTELALDVDASDAAIDLTSPPARRWDGVRLAARIMARPSGSGWELTSDRFLAQHEDGRVTLTGRLSADAAEAEPRLALRATLADASLESFRKLIFPPRDGEADSHRALPVITAGRIENGRIELEGPLGELPLAGSGENFEGSLAIRDASLAGTDHVPAFSGVDAQVAWQGGRFRAEVARGQAAGAQLASARAEWALDAVTPTRVTGRGFGRLETALDWLREHPQAQPVAHDLHTLDARGDALLEFDATVPRQVERAARVRLGLTLDGVRVVPGRALPVLEDLRGTLTLADGRLRRSTLNGRWLGGPVALRIAERRTRELAVIELRAEGTFEAAQLARAMGLDGRDRLRGRAPWLGRLDVVAGKDVSVNGYAETGLAGVISALPQPLAKTGAEPLALRFEVESAPGSPATLRLRAGSKLRGTFALAAGDSGWTIERGAVRMGAGSEPTLPPQAVVIIDGRVAQLDLPAWLAVARDTRSQGTRAPLSVDLEAESLEIAGREFADAKLTALEEDARTQLDIAAPALAGSVLVPHEVTADAPVRVALERLELPPARADATPGQLVAWLAPAATIDADGFTWGGRRLGRLSASLRANGERVRIDDVRVAGATHSVQGAAQCAATLDTCRLEMDVTSSDVAQTLRDFDLADDVHATKGRLTADLDWHRRADRPWLASLNGKLAFSVEDGIVRSVTHDEPPFAPFAMPALLAQNASIDPEPGSAAPEFAFARLEADYELRDGNAYTSNLHLDGGTEIVARGRVGLTDRDYDQVAWVLQGEERLPAAVRRFGATPQVAAAWLRLRDWLGATEPPESRAVLHLHGSWTRPIVGLPAHEEVTP
jgi:uncharacterized protein YhdP